MNTTLVMTDHLIPGATLVMEDGKIVDFGKKIDTAGLEIIDAKGGYTGIPPPERPSAGHQLPGLQTGKLLPHAVPVSSRQRTTRCGAPAC